MVRTSSFAKGVGTHLGLRNLLFRNSLRCGFEFDRQARGFAPWYPQDHFFRVEHAVHGQSPSADFRDVLPGETVDYGFLFSVPVVAADVVSLFLGDVDTANAAVE